MAKLPDVTSMGRRGTPSVLQPVVRQSGRESAQALEGLGQSMSKVHDELYRNQAEAEVTEARNALNEFDAQLHDPNTGLASKRGKDAFELTEKVPAEFDAYSQKFIGKLKNKRAREIASEMALGRRAQLQRTVGDYVTRERETYETGQYKAGMESSINRVGVNPAAVEDELKYQTIATTGRLKKRGASDEEITTTLGALRAETHGAVVDGYIARGQYTQARAYFDKNTAAFGPKSDEYGRRTKSAIEHDLIVKERQQAQAERDVRRNAYAVLEASDKSLPVEAVLRDSLPAINAVPKLRDELDARQRERAKGVEPVTNDKVYYELDQMAVDNPQKFGELELAEFSRFLAPNDFKTVSGLQRRVKAGEVAGFQTTRDVREGMVKELFPNAKGASAEKANALRRRFDEALQAELESTGKKANSQAAQAIKKALLTEIVTEKDWWPDSKQAVYEIGIEDVPAADKAEIEAALTRNGRTVSEQAVVDLYLRGRSK